MALPQPGRKKSRSLANELRYMKVYEAEVPTTRLLDTRGAFALDPVIDPKKKVRQARQETRRAPISPARVRATLDPGRRWEGL